ncbi:hypothetical protein J6590_036082 [Homalodisca vitripennis]|nr:hypothetical protein J6590_036082 [Homalodisca vitripennis]
MISSQTNCSPVCHQNCPEHGASQHHCSLNSNHQTGPQRGSPDLEFTSTLTADSARGNEYRTEKLLRPELQTALRSTVYSTSSIERGHFERVLVQYK